MPTRQTCSDCGQPAHGEGGRAGQWRPYCDECALDLDIPLTPYAFVVEANAEAANAEAARPRRRSRVARATEIACSAELPEPELDVRFDWTPLPIIASGNAATGATRARNDPLRNAHVWLRVIGGEL